MTKRSVLLPEQGVLRKQVFNKHGELKRVASRKSIYRGRVAIRKPLAECSCKHRKLKHRK